MSDSSVLSSPPSSSSRQCPSSTPFHPLFQSTGHPPPAREKFRIPNRWWWWCPLLQFTVLQPRPFNSQHLSLVFFFFFFFFSCAPRPSSPQTLLDFIPSTFSPPSSPSPLLLLLFSIPSTIQLSTIPLYVNFLAPLFFPRNDLQKPPAADQSSSLFHFILRETKNLLKMNSFLPTHTHRPTTACRWNNKVQCSDIFWWLMNPAVCLNKWPILHKRLKTGQSQLPTTWKHTRSACFIASGSGDHPK